MADYEWIFQANPDHFPIFDRFPVGFTSFWRAPRYRKEREGQPYLAVGEEGIVWVSGPAGGILGTFEIVAAPQERTDPENPDEEATWRVGLRYTRRLSPMIPREAIESHPVLGRRALGGELPVFLMPRGTVYHVDDASQRAALSDLIDNTEVSEPDAARESVAELAGRGRPRQGRGLSGPERRAVELHAMGLAREWFEPLVDEIEDVSGRLPYDFRCRRGGRELHVEVKGTTTGGEEVLLTRGEVRDHDGPEVDHALVVVSEIELSDGPEDSPCASGGFTRVWDPWVLDKNALTAVGFSYSLEGTPPSQHRQAASP